MAAGDELSQAVAAYRYCTAAPGRPRPSPGGGAVPPAEGVQRTFAFWKPKPMETDLGRGARRGGMADVAHAMARSTGDRWRPKPVGQLDKNTTGLMIFTTDGRLAFHLNNHVSKSYRVGYLGWEGPGVRAAGALTEEEVGRITGRGLYLAKEQRHASFDAVRLVPGRCELPSARRACGERVHKFKYEAEVALKCGAFHVVKRLLDAAGKAVHALERVRVGGLCLQDLALARPGSFCELSEAEEALLWDHCELCSSVGGRGGIAVEPLRARQSEKDEGIL